MKENEASLVTFDDYAYLVKDFGSTKEELIDGVNSLVDLWGTNVYQGLNLGINKLISKESSNSKIAILICDGDVNNVDSVIAKAKENNIKIYTINIAYAQSHTYLEKIASETGGAYYYATTAEKLTDILMAIQCQTITGMDTTDTDGDGLYDVIEIRGVKDIDGNIVTSDPLLPDTDNDGLLDSEEIIFTDEQEKFNYSEYLSGTATYFQVLSNPNLKDSDYDGIDDIDDIDEDEELKMNIRNVSSQSANLNFKMLSVSSQSAYTYLTPNSTNSDKKNTKLMNEFSGIFKTKATHSNASYKEKFKIDYRWFFEDNTNFNKDLCHMASILAGLAYDNGYTFNKDSIGTLMKKHTDGYDYFDIHQGISDYHGTHVYVGHKLVDYNNKTKEVVIIDVRGTDGKEEWISNFDIGNTNQFTNEKDWTNVNNHKGFDIAATRVLEKVNYIIDNELSKEVTEKPAVLIMGHSRGAAIANILAIKMNAKSNVGDIYAYTFATPYTTTASDSVELAPYIYNVANSEDLVTYLPLTKWDFKRYGNTIRQVLTTDQKKEFKNRVGEKHKANTISKISSTLTALGEIASDRNACYRKGNVDAISMGNIEYQNMLPELAQYTEAVPSLEYGYVDVYQYPMFLMTYLGIAAGGATGEKVDMVVTNVATKYENAKWKFIDAARNMPHPHYIDSYILMY